MDKELKEGQKIGMAYLENQDMGFWQVGMSNVESIIVIEVKGQMAYVPWLKIKYSDGREQLVNCAKLAAIEKAKP